MRLLFAPVTKSEKKGLLFAVGFAVIGRLGALQWSLGLDDWALLRHPFGFSLNQSMLIAQGRFVEGAVSELLIRLGVGVPGSYLLFTVLSVVTFLVIGLWIARFWEVNDNAWAVAVIGGALSTHPYAVEQYLLRIGIPFLALSSLIGFASIFYDGKNAKGILLASLGVALGLCIYQIFLNFLLVTILLALPLWLSFSSRRSPRENIWRVAENFSSVR